MALRAGPDRGLRAAAPRRRAGGARLTTGVAGPGGRTRVLYVINDLARAGAETQLVTLALALPAERYEVRIVLLKHRNDFADALG